MFSFSKKKLLTFITILSLTLQTRKYCASRNSLSTCSKCFNSKYNPLTQNCEVPKNPKKNCKEYTFSEDTKCLTCNFGFGKTQSGLCKKCLIKNCAICDENIFTCKSCFNGYISNFENCEKKKNLKCLKKNCAICDAGNLDICYKCFSRFSLNFENECVKGIPKCTIVSDFEKCFLCESGYFLDKNFSCVFNEFKEIYLFRNLVFWSGFLAFLIFLAVFYIRVFKKKFGNVEDGFKDDKSLPILEVSTNEKD